MTKKETIQVLQSIEDRAVDFPYMTACDWVAIAAAKRHLENALEVKEVDLDYIKKELDEVVRIYKPNGHFGWGTLYNVATHFFELGLKAQKGE